MFCHPFHVYVVRLFLVAIIATVAMSAPGCGKGEVKLEMNEGPIRSMMIPSNYTQQYGGHILRYNVGILSDKGELLLFDVRLPDDHMYGSYTNFYEGEMKRSPDVYERVKLKNGDWLISHNPELKRDNRVVAVLKRSECEVGVFGVFIEGDPTFYRMLGSIQFRNAATAGQ